MSNLEKREEKVARESRSAMRVPAIESEVGQITLERKSLDSQEDLARDRRTTARCRLQ